MSTKVRVGIFALLALAGILTAFYFIENLSLRSNGYEIGVHFHDVGGLQPGSSVLLSGVQVGEVTEVDLLPDQTVDVVCTIGPGTKVYRDSVFLVAITFTGQTTLNITPPAAHDVAMILPQHPLPEDEQPWGTLPPTLADLVSAGQEQMKRLDKTLAVVNRQLPGLFNKFTDVANDSDRLINNANMALAGVGGQLGTTVGLLDATIQTSGRNLDELTGNVNGLVTENRGRLSALAGNLEQTSANLNKTMQGVAAIAQDPSLHESLVGTAANVEAATEKLKAIATDIQGITGDPQTQSELRGTIQNLSSAAARANDILGRYSHASATVGKAGPGSGATPSASPQPGNAGPAPSGATGSGGLFGGPIATAQIRETWGNRGGGPASDVMLELFPAAKTHLSVGANDLGYGSTYNLLLDKRESRDFEVGGGVLYSKLGVAALFRPFGGPVGVDARLYDPKHPTLDLYGDLRLEQRLRLFYGERSIWGPAARTPSFGLQVDY